MFLYLLWHIYPTCAKWLKHKKYWILCWCERSNWQLCQLFHLKNVRRVQERCAEELCESRPLSMNYDTRDNNWPSYICLAGCPVKCPPRIESGPPRSAPAPRPVTPDGWILETGTLMNLLKLCPFIIIVLLRHCHLTTSFILQ